MLGEIPHTVVSGILLIIRYGASHYWYIVFPVIICWILVEVITRNNHDYNSDNGFTSAFNSFIGGAVFYLSEEAIQFIFKLILGDTASCITLFTSSFYLLPFITTGLFLHLVRFWPYWRLPFTRKKIRLY